ncbi:MAG: hypothetical protein HY320_00925 [Armatimonadetes bacterium]|nr:hypothetical protein [Armatimonadota bacterium]
MARRLAGEPVCGLRVALFGPFAVQVGGQPLPRLRSRAGQWLLALVVLRHGQEVSREWLAGTLWPDSPDELALYNLRRNLVDLRHALGPEACRLHSPTPRTLRLDVSSAFVDVLAFDELVARADWASLESATRLYRGPLLEGCTEYWIYPEREARQQAYLRALEKLAEHALALGEHSVAVSYLCRLIAVEPLRDSAQRALMRALADGGDMPAAVLVYREYRTRLHRELNMEPDAQTCVLFSQIQAAARREGAGRRRRAQTERIASGP